MCRVRKCFTANSCRCEPKCNDSPTTIHYSAFVTLPALACIIQCTLASNTNVVHQKESSSRLLIVVLLNLAWDSPEPVQLALLLGIALLPCFDVALYLQSGKSLDCSEITSWGKQRADSLQHLFPVASC